MVCNTCLQDKEPSLFPNDHRLRSGKRGTCKECNRIAAITWRTKNPLSVKESNRKKWQKFKHKYIPKNREWYVNNRERTLQQKKEYYSTHKNKILQRDYEYRCRKKGVIPESTRPIKIKRTEEEKRLRAKERHLRNNPPKTDRRIGKRKSKEERIKQTTAWAKMKRQTDPIFRLTQNLRRRLSLALQKSHTSKGKRTFEYLGCSIEDFKKYLELRFQSGMTWENHGMHGWHIDHIIPCNAFDLTKEEERCRCFHYTNLQPLWAKDNLKKGDKIENLQHDGSGYT